MKKSKILKYFEDFGVVKSSTLTSNGSGEITYKSQIRAHRALKRKYHPFGNNIVIVEPAWKKREINQRNEMVREILKDNLSKYLELNDLCSYADVYSHSRRLAIILFRQKTNSCYKFNRDMFDDINDLKSLTKLFRKFGDQITKVEIEIDPIADHIFETTVKIVRKLKSV